MDTIKLEKRKPVQKIEDMMNPDQPDTIEKSEPRKKKLDYMKYLEQPAQDYSNKNKDIDLLQTAIQQEKKCIEILPYEK